MKATGIVRRIDDLGRVVVPKEIRKVLRIREGDPLEIYTGTAGEVILKKYSPINELGQIAKSFAETASTVLGLPVLISDTDRFIAASGLRKKDYLNQQIDTALDEIIQCKEKSRTASRLVVPILTNGDPIGSVTVLPTENHALTEAEVKTAELGAKLLACQMEN
ncbi:AbrB/MazE/SpoVT family DNA-binding domain-containing protein [Clostridiales Family XIII bacterium BX16]|uniref:AbrB/MazE/SpoVT family DNA-binding domain-containing protein n=1 Tax=Lentihominibacter faecis TaxID=2764712 RepID=A0A923NEZ4_9FIRM|nr:stage V sporulation T C-terminal domain-containing protein [Lentihominibacter faecis]MBC5998940.1 AbrB/MazE/SpoVT family DNA-binding domain-containing protein [Lentihominibacter faecis]